MQNLTNYFKSLWGYQIQDEQWEDKIFEELLELFINLLQKIKNDPLTGIDNFKNLIHNVDQNIKICFTSFPPIFQSSIIEKIQYSECFWKLYFLHFLLVFQCQNDFAEQIEIDIIQQGNQLFNNQFEDRIVKPSKELFHLITNYQISRNSKIRFLKLDQPLVKIISQTIVDQYLAPQFEISELDENVYYTRNKNIK